MTSDDVINTVRTALAEDLGPEDVSAALIPAQAQARATVISRQPAVICGRPWFNEVFHQIDTSIALHWQIAEGEQVQADQALCELRGPARALLSGERAALNFLQTLSGTATRARQYADAVQGIDVMLLDTRKTLPGLRQAQKYASQCGGCHNHRMGLYDGILIKENHIQAAGSLHAVLQQALSMNKPGMLLEIEVENLEQLREALAAGAPRLLLDNFSLEQLREAVQIVDGKAFLEASGGVTLQTLRAIAETGVDAISIGDLTKSVEAIDLSMRFEQA